MSGSNTTNKNENYVRQRENREARERNLERQRNEIREYEKSRLAQRNQYTITRNSENRSFFDELHTWLQEEPKTGALDNFINKVNETNSFFSKGIYRHYINPIWNILDIELLPFLMHYKNNSIGLLYHLHGVFVNFDQNTQLNEHTVNLFIEAMNNYYIMITRDTLTLDTSNQLIYQALNAFKYLLDMIKIKLRNPSSFRSLNRTTQSSPNGSSSHSPNSPHPSTSGGYYKHSFSNHSKKQKIKEIKKYCKKIIQLLNEI